MNAGILSGDKKKRPGRADRIEKKEIVIAQLYQKAAARNSAPSAIIISAAMVSII